MQITWSPMRSDQTLSLSKSGDVLTVNGEVYDLTVIEEGDVLPRNAVVGELEVFLASEITRVAGVLHLTLRVPHGPDAGPGARSISSITANDGVIDLPS